MRKMFLGIFLTAMLAIATMGCEGAPRFGYNVDRSTPGNHVGAGRFYLDLNENTKLTATGIKSGRKGLFHTQFDADSLTLEQDHSTWEGLVQAAALHQLEQQTYFTGVNTITKTVFDGIPPIIRELVPSLDKMIQAKGDAALVSAYRGSVLQQALGGIIGDRFSLESFAAATKNIDPTLATDLAAKIAVTPK